MLNKISLVFLVVFSIYFVNNADVSAHVLESNRTIGAILHIDPDDNPTVDRQQEISLFFKDTENKFTFDNCLCKLQLYLNGELISEEPLLAQTDTSSNNIYIFEKEGDYNLKVIGQSTNNDDFARFEIDYQIKVTDSGTVNNNEKIGLSLVAGLLILQALVLVRVYLRVGK